MAFVFAWDEWNTAHVSKHGCTAPDAKFLIRHAEAPFPREIGDDKFLVWGKNAEGRHLQVVFAFRLSEELEFTSLTFMGWSALIDYAGTVVVYVIHCMPLNTKQLRQYRKIRSDK
jgi:uncharacterized DUF497 family protein